jgi:hypothetical protein
VRPYEEYLLEEFEKLKEEYPAVINTAKEYNEGFRIILAAMKRRTQAHEAVLTKWLKENL